MTSYLIQGASVLGVGPRDLAISGGRFVDALSDPDVVIDARGLVALPGLVDLHTHLREPGYEASETILTGSRAARALTDDLHRDVADDEAGLAHAPRRLRADHTFLERHGTRARLTFVAPGQWLIDR